MNLDQLLKLENITNYQVCWYGKDIAEYYLGDDGLLHSHVSFRNKNPDMNKIYIILYGIDGKRSMYMYAIKFVEKLPDLIDGNVCFKWERVPLRLDKYSNRMIFIKESGYSFYNNSGEEFEINEINYPKLNRSVPYFNSYDDVELTFNELKEVIENKYNDYYKHLSCIKAIYMIIDGNTGKQYIGSAYGKNGLYGRWEEYINTYHGNNEEFIELFNKNGMEYFEKFKFIILQILPLKMSDREIVDIETKYKNKFLTKVFGLNKN